MEKTADLAMIQKTNIDALHKEGKSQKVITERCGCLQTCPGPVLTYISLLIIPCMIVYVTNNKEP